MNIARKVLAGLVAALTLAAFAGSQYAAAQSSETVLVSNLGQGDTSTELFVTQSGNHRRAIRFTVGSIAGNYSLHSVVIDLETVPTDAANFHVRIMYGGDGTDPGGVKSNLTAPATLVVGHNTYTAPANTELTTGANYFVMYEYAGTGSDSVRIAATITGDVDSGAAEGWDIHNESRRWQASSFRWVTSNPEPKFQIRGSAKVSSDATLSALSLSGVTLSPTFASDTTTYTASVASSVSSTTVTATPNHASASAVITPADAFITSGHQVNLGVGDTVITVAVTAQDTTTTKTYKVTVTRAVPPSDDATLRALSLSGVSLSPAFAPATTTYTASVANSVSSTTVTATPNHASASVRITGGGTSADDEPLPVNLGVGDTVITVWVTAEDGTVKSYTVTVTRAAAQTLQSNDATLRALSLSGVTLSRTFASGTTTYTANVANSVSSTTVTATTNHASASAVITPGDASGASGHQVNLRVGNTVITVAVTAEDGRTTRTYTVTVTRAAAQTLQSNDATLRALSLSGVTLSRTFASGTTTYTANVANSVSSTTVTATTNHASASAVITPGDASGASGHQVNLRVGNTVITVAVTAGDGRTTRTYTVTVTRAAAQTLQSNDATLRALSLSGVTLSRTFASGTTTYTANVANSVSSTTVTATTNHASASVVITPGDASGASGHQVNLRVGNTVITVAVTAEDGRTTRTYTVTVTRAAAQTLQSNDATLRALSLSGVTLSRTFASGTTTYTANVANSVSSTTVTATTNHASASAVITPGDASGASGHQVNLRVGDTRITVAVTAGDGRTTRTYTVTVTRAAVPPSKPKAPKAPSAPPAPAAPAPAPTPQVVIGATSAATAIELPGDRLLIQRHDVPDASFELAIGSISADGLTVVLAGVIRDETFEATYIVVRRASDDQIVRRWVPPGSPLVSQIPWAVVNTRYTVPVGVVAAIPLDDQFPEPNQLVRRFEGDDDRIFAYDAALQQWRYVPDIATFQALGFYWCNVTAADTGFFERISHGPAHPASEEPARDDYPSCLTS